MVRMFLRLLGRYRRAEFAPALVRALKLVVTKLQPWIMIVQNFGWWMWTIILELLDRIHRSKRWKYRTFKADPAYRVHRPPIEHTLMMCILQGVFIEGLLVIERRTWLVHSDRWRRCPFGNAKSCPVPRKKKNCLNESKQGLERCGILYVSPQMCVTELSFGCVEL